MHLKKLTFRPQDYPKKDIYPFSLNVFQNSPALEFDTKITFFCGENGSGKSTLLKAITKRCGHIYLEGIWQDAL